MVLTHTHTHTISINVCSLVVCVGSQPCRLLSGADQLFLTWIKSQISVMMNVVTSQVLNKEVDKEEEWVGAEDEETMS